MSAIVNASNWVAGYGAGLKYRPFELPKGNDFAGSCAAAAALAKGVLDVNGAGGPDDHELLALAILELNSAVVEGKPNATDSSDSD